MKQQPLLLSLLAAAALLSITAYAEKAQDARTLEERVDSLEQEVQAMRATLAGLGEASSAGASQLDAINAYLKKQAQSAKRMEETLAEAESLGFVAGINHASRSTLLSGWRDSLAVRQKGLPGPSTDKPKAAARTRR